MTDREEFTQARDAGLTKRHQRRLASLGVDVLQDAADRASTFDPELEKTLRDMAADYAGPESEGLRERPVKQIEGTFPKPEQGARRA